MNALARIEAAYVDGARVVHIFGEIDLSNARRLLLTIGGEMPPDAHVLIVDLTNVSYLDSSGISMLFRLAERLSFSRQELRLVVPLDSPIRKVLELTNVPQVIPVQETLA